MDPLDHAGRYNNFLTINHKSGVADIQPKVIGQQALGVGGLTVAELSTSAYSSSNVVNTLVYRDGSGNFAAGTITGKTTGNENPLTFNAPFSRSIDTISYSGDLPLSAHNIITDTTTGTKIGTATNQKLAFFNSTPIVQPSGVGSATGYTTGTTVATFHSDDTYTGNVGATAYTLNGIVAALKNLGLIAS
ncbi:MAG TPA: hypothetical protein VF941_11810 [Clostridia bacterium]